MRGPALRVMLAMALPAIALAPVLARTGTPAGRSTLELHGRPLALRPAEQPRFIELDTMVRGANRAAQDRALAAAEAIAESADARYALAVYQFEIGRQRRDDALRARGLDVLVASPRTPAARIPGYLATRGEIAFRNRDYATASSAWTRLLELQPNDAQTLFNVAQLRLAQDDRRDAVRLIRLAVDARRTGSEPVPENWYRQWLSAAHGGRLVEEGVAAAQALIAAYPTRDNWRYGLVAYRQLASPEQPAEIELLRLMRTAGALVRPAEYQRFAQLLLHAGSVVEARALLREGISRGIVTRDEPTTRAISAEIDRAAARHSRPVGTVSNALPPGPPDRLRLAADLALAGRRDEAASAFRAITEGSGAAPLWHADLARFWLVWLGSSASAS